ncbi:MAG: HAMP domain-containing histidine kinase [Lachnospiraceae bacterium]|nr:HAMP domain-containing histidine kinase [Lachnospiraceae bacterium]
MDNKSNKKNKSKLVNFVLHSIRAKLILLISILLLITLGGFLLANKVLLPSYYRNKKIKMMQKSFDAVNVIVNKDSAFNSAESEAELSDASTLGLEILEANNSTNIYIFELTDFFNTVIYDFKYPESADTDLIERNNIREQTMEYITGLYSDDKSNDSQSTRKAIKKTKNYSVYMVYDKRIGSNYIELFGKLKSGSIIFMRSNYQSMSENVNILNKFLSIVGLIILLLAIIAMIVISSRFTRPIRELDSIAKKMAKLDFDAKYEVTTQDEIGTLGANINSLSEKLEETISELKTANNELQSDIEEKVQIDNMRKEFLSNVSHELKTPIALIQGYAEGLADNINDDEESRQFYCDVIIDEADKMNKMVKKLLSLNQIEFGNNQINIERFDITEVITSVSSSSALLAEQKETSIDLKLSNNQYVWAEEYMIEEVITNYISNAINHVEEVDGVKKIEVTYEDKGDILRVNVFNTGKNIPEEELEKVWIKFYKVDKARTREYGGSGIGLSIVKAIMDSLNRECGVYNVSNGVVFWFELDKTMNI